MTAECGAPASLRRTVTGAFAVLAVFVLAGAGIELWLLRDVHRDVVLLFEELREVSLARTLVDELRGVQSWAEAMPSANSGTHPEVLDDVRRHHAAARQTLSRFARADDPSRAEHTEDEQRLFDRLVTQLDALGRALADDQPLRELQAPLATALHAALAVSHAVDVESRKIGNALDERSDDMAQLLLVLGLCSVATVGGLGWLLLRRVLRPVGELRDAALRLGRGEQDLHLPTARPDELGDLAKAFAAMAGQLQDHQRDLEQRVEERSREVLRSARLAQLGTLAAGIAHEINNPLASIVACSDGLLRALRAGTTDADHLREYLEILRKEAMRVRDITTKLLRFARDEQSRREVVALREHVQEVAALFAHQLGDAGVALQLEAGDLGEHSSACAVLGDAAELRQVVFNLLRNALDASPRGGRIVVACRRLGSDLELAVRDEGPGIPDELKERVFEPFFTTKDPGRGTGLGLSIVHRIVTAHGGSIRLEDAKPGVRVVVTLPAASA